MRISQVSLQHYRNIELARLEFGSAQPAFFVGANGQGKSNMLEALGLITAVRSFRTSELGPLVQKGRRQARVLFAVQQADGSEISVELQISSRTRKILVDEIPVTRMSDFVGQFPSVVFAADDTQLIKLSPQARRRFFDLLLSIVDHDYLEGLQQYHRGIKERNNALKHKMERAVVVAYDRLLAKWGLFVMQKRQLWLEQFSPLYQSNYLRISDAEAGSIGYKTASEIDSEEAYLKKLASGYERDLILGSTQFGPHRDDYQFVVSEMAAKSHGSDGQQRSVVLALKLAQIEMIEAILKRKPIVLLDDILGELDDARKERFWSVFDHGCQVFASGTSLPDHQGIQLWDVFRVNDGAFEAQGQ